MELYNEFDDCLGTVIDSIKQLLFARHDNIFDRLDFEQDEIYQEPLLYTYVGQQENKWLDCIIYGYEKQKKQVIEVFSNNRGVIYIPKIGYFKTNWPHQTFILKTNNEGVQLEFEDRKIDYDFELPLLLENGMELITHQHPLLESVFTDQLVHDREIVVQDVHRFHLENLNKGLGIINKCNPVQYKLLLKNLKKIMLFKANKPNSFAVMTAHNMIFLNVNPWNTELFFADHIAHEGGHVIFYTLTYESKYKLFNFHPNTPFSEIKGHEEDHGTAYLSLHGLFTYYEITKCLKIYVDEGRANSPKLFHEAKGRLSFHLKRFKRGIELFEKSTIFLPEGMKWFNVFKQHYYLLKNDHEKLIKSYDLGDQPYDFNSKIFEELNPI